MRNHHVRGAGLFAIAAMAAGWSIASHAFTVSVDDFSVVRNNATIFHDDFGDGIPPPSGPNGAATYNILGSAPSEAGGTLLLDSASGATSADALGQQRIEQRIRLLTNIDPANLAAGLKSDDTLSLTGIFSLTTPSGVFNPQYSIRFNDASSGAVHQLAQLQVRLNSATGLPQIRYLLQDFDAHTITVLGSAALTPPAGADQILLNISRPSTASDDAFASFDYLSNGVSVGGGASFATPAQLFQGENFVRAEFNISDGVAPVPEPATYALMLGGLGLLGLAVRRRTQEP